MEETELFETLGEPIASHQLADNISLYLFPPKHFDSSDFFKVKVDNSTREVVWFGEESTFQKNSTGD